MLALPAQPAPLSEQEARGKQLYLNGVVPGHEAARARLGTLDLPASSVSCASCHGYDGRGRPEGAVVPPPITWAELTKPYGHVHPFGRRHPPFTEATLARAVVEGVDPGGNALDPAMPRYALDAAALEDLIAYLKRLGSEPTPGLSAEEIRIGTLLPLQGPAGRVGRAVREVLLAYFAELNASGGIHGRRLRLVVEEVPADREATLAAAERLHDASDVFALLSPYAPGAAQAVVREADRRSVPLIAPLGVLTATEALPFAFHIDAGAEGQARALVRHVHGLALQERTGAVVYPDTAEHAQLAAAARAEGDGRGLGWDTHAYPPSGPGGLERTVRALSAAGAGAVLFLGPGQDLSAFRAAAGAVGWDPYLLVPGALAAPDTLAAAGLPAGRVLLAYTLLPPDASPAGRGLRALLARHALAGDELPAGLSAYAGAGVLTEALKRAGRDLDRHRLVAAMEGIRAFPTGVSAPLSYGPNRRIGALGAFVLSSEERDGSTRVVGRWVPVE
jgi:ABC-type branched-subunit amino acid transport system substrate-binding protein